jgi:hypothetical protein
VPISAQSDLIFMRNTGELDQVPFGRYTAVLNFRRLTISIVTLYKVTDPDGNCSVHDPEGNLGGAAIFANLLNASIDSYEVVESSQPQILIRFSTNSSTGINQSFITTPGVRCWPTPPVRVSSFR